MVEHCEHSELGKGARVPLWRDRGPEASAGSLMELWCGVRCRGLVHSAYPDPRRCADHCRAPTAFSLVEALWRGTRGADLEPGKRSGNVLRAGRETGEASETNRVTGEVSYRPSCQILRTFEIVAMLRECSGATSSA